MLIAAPAARNYEFPGCQYSARGKLGERFEQNSMAFVPLESPDSEQHAVLFSNSELGAYSPRVAPRSRDTIGNNRESRFLDAELRAILTLRSARYHHGVIGSSHRPAQRDPPAQSLADVESTVHGGFYVGKALRRRIALRWAMRRSDHTVMVSSATQRQYCTELGVQESRFTVIPNGVPTARGDARTVRAEFGIAEEDCVLLAVGTLERHKGHRVLLEALAELPSRGVLTPWKLVIAGGRGGDQHQSLLEYIREKNLGDRVRIVLNRDDIADLL